MAESVGKYKRKGRRRLSKLVGLVVIMCLTLTACGEKPVEERSYSTWIVEWDSYEGLKEIEELPGDCRIAIFAVSYDRNLNFSLPSCMKEVSYLGREGILTFVNDIEGEKEKNPELIENKLNTPEKREEEAEKMVRLTVNNGFGTIEVDYEGMGRSMNMWRYYIQFISILHEECKKEKLDLRIVLEPSIPYERLSFPKGPEYVIMCYNLHGPFSYPGPKADREFIHKVCKKTTMLERRTLAFATGGYHWIQEKDAVSLTEEEALQLQKKYHVSAKREQDSLCFFYTDEDGKRHQVWYADRVTLQRWEETARQDGIDAFAFWRLGGNRQGSWTAWREEAFDE